MMRKGLRISTEPLLRQVQREHHSGVGHAMRAACAHQHVPDIGAALTNEHAPTSLIALGPQEREQVGIDPVRMSSAHTVRRPRINLQRRVFDDLGR
jgi:hypothetical protein